MSFLGYLRTNAAFLSVGALLTLTSSFGQTFFIALFAGEIQLAFGLSHGAWGSIYGIGTGLSAVVMIWSGALTDIFRVRVLAVFVLSGLALACLAMALNPVVWMLPVVIFALRLFGQGMSSHLATVAMARWFVATRGRALAIASFGYSFGEAILPVTFVALLAVTSWRSLWVLAAVLALLALPAVLRLLRLERTPQSIAAESTAVGMEGRHWTRAQVIKHWLFPVMLPALIGPSAFNTAFFFLQVHIAEEKGWGHLNLVALFPVYTAVTVAAVLCFGLAIDRFGTRWPITVWQVPIAIGFFVMAGAETLGMAAVALVFIAISSGASATVPAAFWAEYYGTRHIGAIKALAISLMVLGSAIGPWLCGMAIDRGVPFPEQMWVIGVWFLGVSVVNGVAIARARSALPARTP
jgi:MFS family permease